VRCQGEGRFLSARDPCIPQDAELEAHEARRLRIPERDTERERDVCVQRERDVCVNSKSETRHLERQPPQLERSGLTRRDERCRDVPSTLTPHRSTLTPRSSTLTSQRSTLTPHPSTLNPHPSTLTPQPSPFNLQPPTLNPGPWTLNPKQGKSFTGYTQNWGRGVAYT